MEIKFENVSYTSNKNTSLEHEILKDISFEIVNEKVTSIIGKSGAGKTTIVELMDGLLIPTSGKITIGSKIIEENGLSKKELNDLRKNIGLVFQSPEEQFFNITVKDEIAFGMKYYKYKQEELEKRVKDVLKMVGLKESILKENPFSLSSGDKRKVAIASILILNPKIIIFDEPTIGLDYESKKNLSDLIRKLKVRYKKTIIIISHDIEFVHKVTDQVIILNNKRIYTSGNKYDVFKNEDEIKQIGLKVPKMISFSNMVKERKNIRLGYRDNINDLIKDIYRCAK